MFCSVSKQSEMDREPNCRFCKKSLISGKRINTVPVFGVSRNKTLLVDSGQDSVVLAQAFDSSRFPPVQGESFSDLSLNRSYINYGELHFDSVNASLVFFYPLDSVSLLTGARSSSLGNSF